jgi:hypothetical protein
MELVELVTPKIIQSFVYLTRKGSFHPQGQTEESELCTITHIQKVSVIGSMFCLACLPSIAIPPIRKQDGSWARTNKEKTNLFANYFATVFPPNNKNNNNANYCC